MSEVRLQVKNLCKSFGITKAVQNVSFNVNKGEVHALIPMPSQTTATV